MARTGVSKCSPLAGCLLFTIYKTPRHLQTFWSETLKCTNDLFYFIIDIQSKGSFTLFYESCYSTRCGWHSTSEIFGMWSSMEKSLDTSGLEVYSSVVKQRFKIHILNMMQEFVKCEYESTYRFSRILILKILPCVQDV